MAQTTISTQSEFAVGTTTYQVTSVFYEQEKNKKEKEDFITKMRRLILNHQEDKTNA